MCFDPITMGAVLGAGSSIMAAMSQAAALKANAQAAKLEATYERQRGTFEAGRLDERLDRVQGQQVAAFGAQGLSIQSGSPSEVILDTAQEGALDVLAIKHNAEARARTKDFEAKISKSQIAPTIAGGVVNAFASVVNSFGQNPTRLSSFGSSVTNPFNRPQFGFAGNAS